MRLLAFLRCSSSIVLTRSLFRRVQGLRSFRTLAQAANSAASAAAQPASTTEASTSTAKNGAATASSSSSSAVSGVEITEYFKPSGDSLRELLSHVEHERFVLRL